MKKSWKFTLFSQNYKALCEAIWQNLAELGRVLYEKHAKQTNKQNKNKGGYFCQFSMFFLSFLMFPIHILKIVIKNGINIYFVSYLKEEVIESICFTFLFYLFLINFFVKHKHI